MNPVTRASTTPSIESGEYSSVSWHYNTAPSTDIKDESIYNHWSITRYTALCVFALSLVVVVDVHVAL